MKPPSSVAELGVTFVFFNSILGPTLKGNCGFFVTVRLLANCSLPNFWKIGIFLNLRILSGCYLHIGCIVNVLLILVDGGSGSSGKGWS